jgi:glycosyltransferase involved in cell wall biosynthesis
MNDKRCPVSVIIPVHNRPEEITRAVSSALGQRPYPPAEVIVVDDASTDETATVAEAAGATVIRLERNGGAAVARNAGIAAARQDWLAFLDSDDEWLPDLLATLWPARDDHVLVAGTAIRAGEGPLAGRIHGGASGEREVLHSPAQILFPENRVPMSAALARCSDVVAAGGFNEHIRFSEDFDLWLRLLERGPALLLPDVVARYYVHRGQKSGRRAELRTAQDAIVSSYEDRPWLTKQVRERRRTVGMWDDLRASWRGGQRRDALAAGWWLARSSRRVRALGEVLSYRYRVRRRSASWAMSTGGDQA